MGILEVDLTEQMIVFLFSAYNQCFDVVFNIVFQGAGQSLWIFCESS